VILEEFEIGSSSGVSSVAACAETLAEDLVFNPLDRVIEFRKTP
jgi:hypothetical protein